MTIWRRIRVYLVGFGLGLLIVYVIFGDRDLTKWTPQSRVIAAIDSADVSITEKANCQLKCLGYSNEKMEQLAREAKVDFGESLVKEQPCPIYRINVKDTEDGDKAVEMMLEVCERKNTSKLLSISKEGVDCDCS